MSLAAAFIKEAREEDVPRADLGQAGQVDMLADRVALGERERAQLRNQVAFLMEMVRRQRDTSGAANG